MSTKTNPGAYDFYSRALPDEPMFVLLARDPFAPYLVEMWAAQREHEIREQKRPRTDAAMVTEARAESVAMRTWRAENDGKWREGPADAILLKKARLAALVMIQRDNAKKALTTSSTVLTEIDRLADELLGIAYGRRA